MESQGDADLSPDELDAVMRLRVDSPAARGSECPEDSEWPVVVAGLSAGGQTETLLQHAAGCDHCGPLLRRYAADFAEELTAEEEAGLGRLASSQPGWQQRMAARMAKPRRRSLTGWFRVLTPPPIPRWAYSGVLAILAVVSVWRIPRPIDALLATAYTEQRTLELRIAKAAYGPVRLVRGGGLGSRLERPPALLEGEARIARDLAQDPRNPNLLQAKGRAELLDWNYDAAVAALEGALKLQPESPTLMTDLASAYFERAEANRHPADYQAAIELLNKAIQMRPEDPVALFNRAIVYERMGRLDQSIADWKHYLRVDPAGGWTSEASKRLAEMEQAKKNAK